MLSTKARECYNYVKLRPGFSQTGSISYKIAKNCRTTLRVSSGLFIPAGFKCKQTFSQGAGLCRPRPYKNIEEGRAFLDEAFYSALERLTRTERST